MALLCDLTIAAQVCRDVVGGWTSEGFSMWLFRKVPRRGDQVTLVIFLYFCWGTFFPPRFAKKKVNQQLYQVSQEISNQSIPDSCGC